MSDGTTIQTDPVTPFSQCSSRFMTVKGMPLDAAGDRMRCARTRNHSTTTQHRNASGDLSWDDGAEIVVIPGTVNGPLTVVSQADIRHEAAVEAIRSAWAADGAVAGYDPALLAPLARTAASVMLAWVETPEGRKP